MQNILDRNFSGEEARIAWSVHHLKTKLLKQFGENLTISEINGNADVVTLKKTASRILHSFYRKQKSADSADESLRLVKTAAALIRSDIMAMNFDRSVYPDFSNLSVESQFSCLPVTLQTLLSEVIKGKNSALKMASIGQSIIQASRPNTCIAPLQVGLAVQLHKTFASRFLVSTLHKMGFCASYAEVNNFQLNAAAFQGLNLPDVTEKTSLQFVADNVDHNCVTLDGRNTFHGMGMIGVVTPGTNKPVKIPRKKVDLAEITALGKVGIYYYRYLKMLPLFLFTGRVRNCNFL